MRAVDARVLLTGASGGIGRAMARSLERAGAQVIGVGRGECGSEGMAWIPADLNAPGGLARVAELAAARQINVVVQAAGLPGFGALDSIAPQQIEQVLRTNLLAPMLLAQALLPQLLRQPRAQLVFVGSALGRIGLPGFSVYGASKAGLHGFAEALRRELADGPVRVQILGPRSTRTPFNGAAVEAYNRATGTAMDTPEQVAEVLLALIESEAAEAFVGFPERLGVRLNGLLGARLDRSFARHRHSLRATRHPDIEPGTTA